MLCALLSIGLIIAPGSRTGQGRSDGATLLRAVWNAYESNRAGFTFGSASFRYSDGFASDVDRARRGRLDRSLEGTGRYTFAGKQGYYGLEFGIEALEAGAHRVTNTRIALRVTSVKTITDGSSTLRATISPTLDVSDRESVTVDLLPGASDFAQRVVFPMSLGVPAEFRSDTVAEGLRQTVEGVAGYRLLEADENATYEGRPALKLVIEEPGPINSTYWIDPDRGAIPRRAVIESAGAKSRCEIYLDDIRQVPGNGWLPFSRTVWFSNDGVTRRLLVDSADFRVRPDQSSFRLEFGRPVVVHDMVRMKTYPSETAWDLSRLPSSRAVGATSAPRAGSPPAEPLPGERENPPFWPWLALAGSGVIVAVMVFAYIHNRS
jgi:hypothetical protein